MTNEQIKQEDFEAYHNAYWSQLSEYDLDQMYQEFLASEGAHTPAPTMPRILRSHSGSSMSLAMPAVITAGYRLAA
jgi:hypothetical protein